jgi:uncharacterized protein
MISDEILSILVCPESKERLTLADPSEVEMINNFLKGEGLQTVGGAAASKHEYDGFLVRADRKIAYPIKDGIPVLLIEEGVVLPESGI